MPGMILLEPGNRILEECVSSQIMAEGPRTPCDVRLCDFDDVSYHIQVDQDHLDVLKLSMNLPCFSYIDGKGGNDALDRIYGKYKADVEPGYHITLNINIPEVEDKAKTVKDLSLLKSNITGSVFDHFFTQLAEKQAPAEPFKFDLRGDTTVYFCPRDDRCTVVFAVDFTEHVDKVLAKVFMQEFVDARKKIGRAPPCAWGANPPNELQAFGITENTAGTLGYISFAVLPGHVTPGKKEVVVSVLQTFRTYLQYHIKCSKSHFHARMRNRVRELLKVLNRAKVDEEKKEKKTAGGKTFKRS